MIRALAGIFYDTGREDGQVIGIMLSCGDFRVVFPGAHQAMLSNQVCDPEPFAGLPVKTSSPSFVSCRNYLLRQVGQVGL